MTDEHATASWEAEAGCRSLGCAVVMRSRIIPSFHETSKLPIQAFSSSFPEEGASWPDESI
ncbi:MAG: hypothetical protein CMJ40_00675 [Phycisphaerae bacterium]|nr:hypothetical protein [Phycisphaerae bacterium]